VRALLGKLRKTSGGGMLEAAITIPVFILVVLMVVDITRYFVAYNVLNYAAFSAADLASKFEIETDTSSNNCPNDNSPTNPCAKYCRRVKAVLARADNIAKSLSSKAPGIGPLNRRIIQHYYEQSEAFGSIPSGSLISDCASSQLDAYGVGFIRPGEHVKTDDSSPKTIEVPTRPFGTAAGQGWPGNGESWVSVLQSQPFQVVMEADFVPVMPLVGKIRMSIRQTAYRHGAGFGRGTRGTFSGGGTSWTPGPVDTNVTTPTPMPTCPACCGLGQCDSAHSQDALYFHCAQCYCAGGCGT
jgi:hypothetical protein